MSDSPDALPRVYNRLLLDMVTNLKREACGRLSATLAATGHVAIDPATTAYIARAAATLDVAGLVAAVRSSRSSRQEEPPTSDDDSAEAAAAWHASDAARAFEVLPGLTAHALAEAAPEGAALLVYALLFATLARAHAVVSECTDAASAAVLARHVLAVLSAAQQGDAASAEEAQSCILDDDVQALLREVAAACARPADGGDGGDADADAAGASSLLSSLEGSRIGALAREITSELDLNELPLDQNPMDLLNFGALGDKNSPLSSLVTKVGAKIQSKLANGELRQEDLLGDALSLLKHMDGGGGGGSRRRGGGNALFGSLMQAAAGMGAGGSGLGGLAASLGAGGGGEAARRAAMRERLRARQQERRSAGDDDGVACSK